jgi:hypothetical protein
MIKKLESINKIYIEMINWKEKNFSKKKNRVRLKKIKQYKLWLNSEIKTGKTLIKKSRKK